MGNDPGNRIDHDAAEVPTYPIAAGDFRSDGKLHRLIHRDHLSLP